MSAAAERLLGPDLRPDEAFARALDEADPLAASRERFEIPPGPDGRTAAYLVGNSLGPLPKGAREALADELDRWSARGVDGWFDGPDGWYGLDERFRAGLADLAGARPAEIAVLNGLTVNLHLALASFFRPRGRRRKILLDAPAFPSDLYAARTQLAWHGLDPAADLLVAGADRTDGADEEALEEVLAARGDEIAVVLVAGVNFLTGRRLDLERIARAARAAGAVTGTDLAHAIGNVPLRLHDWDVDFAVWCHYKYVNAGPGAPGGLFVHERHASRPETPRLGGWWGNDPETRFRLQLEPEFRPRPDAGGWQVGTPPILGLAPLGPALDAFAAAGLPALRDKSLRLTAWLEWLLSVRCPEGLEIVTPADPERRGAQLSLRVRGDGRALQDRLQVVGVIADFREPDILRLAPAPLFNGFHDAWRAVEALAVG
ncbi:MAG: kynureninase [Gemmatimonadota bacterium]|nr:kynureninase [Gemmatimonadota bacterium]